MDYTNSPGQNTAVGSLSLLQGIFPTQGLNPGLSHGRRILTNGAIREEKSIVYFKEKGMITFAKGG